MIAGKLAALAVAWPATAKDTARDARWALPGGAVRAGEAGPRQLGVHAPISVPGVPSCCYG